MSKVIAKGIDISSHQGPNIDFAKVKAAGYDYVIIKAGQGLKPFETFRTKPGYQYQPRAEAAGMDWGAYWWSDAISVSEAKREAKAFIDAVKGLKPTYPLYMDQEYNSPPDRLGMSKEARQLRTDMVKAFLDTLLDAGYYAGLYTSTDWINTRLYDDQLTKYDKWLAQYASKCTYSGDYGMWQHHGDVPGFVGHVNGISTAVDLNDCYKDYPKIIKNNLLNGWTQSEQLDKPAPETESISLDGAAKILKAAGCKSILL